MPAVAIGMGFLPTCLPRALAPVALLISQDTNPKHIQSQLRHASIQMTLDRYGHPFPSDRQKRAARLDITIQSARSNENLTSGVQ